MEIIGEKFAKNNLKKFDVVAFQHFSQLLLINALLTGLTCAMTKKIFVFLDGRIMKKLLKCITLSDKQ